MKEPSFSPVAIKFLFKSGSWFAQLPDDVQNALMTAGLCRNVRAGEKLYRQGDAATGLHGLISGELHITGSGSSGANLLMAIHRAGDWNGFLACIDKQPHAFSALAAVDCTTWSIPLDAITNIFEKDAATFRMLVVPEIRVARRAYHWLVEMTRRPPSQRIAERLIDLGRWTHSERSGPISPIENVNQDALAAATNVSRQTMNSALKALEALGLIKVGYGKIEILDIVALQEYATSPQSKTT